MNDSDLMPDDPKLTAYALGELEGDERAAVEAAVRARPELKAAVEEIRAVVAQVEAALATEPIERLEQTAAEAEEADGVEGREEFAEAAVDRPLRLTRAGNYKARGKLISFPRFYYVAGGLAAAGFAVLVALNRDEYEAREIARAEQMRKAVAKQVVTQAPAAVVRAEPVAESAVAAEGVVTERIVVTETAPVKVAFAPENLALLQQVQRATGVGAAELSRGANAARSDAGAGETLSVLGAPPAAARRAGRDTGTEAAAVTAAQPTLVALSSGAATESVAPSGLAATEETPPRPAESAQGAIASATARAATTTVEEPVTIYQAGGTPAVETQFVPTVAMELFPETPKIFAAPATGAGPAMRYAQMPGNSDVVMLEAFTVSAERVSFGATSPLRRRSGYDPYAEERDYRPRAPTGARFGRQTTGEVRDNDFVSAALEPRSTFAADTDAASYAAVRRAIAQREMPSREAVKIEEMLNYFPYRYAGPAEERKLSFFEKLRGEDGAPPFAAALEVAEAPWAPEHRLVRVALKGREMLPAERPAANLVFLIDVSSSMNEPNKLPLVKESLRLLVHRLRADDRVAIVTYGGNAGLVLPSTPVERLRDILASVEALAPRPPTTGSTGLRLAYEVARERFAEDGINRVILCTDGDFALGTASESELLRLAEERAGSGVFLTVLGFGMGSYRDYTLEQLAWRGNGTYGYIDSRREAQKLLVEQVSSTLVTIAKGVKVQVEFNPARVARYRLIGYENRLLKKEDFDLDHVDGGEIGAGHTITALYEVVPAAGGRTAMGASPWRGGGNELLTVTVRYKKPDGIFSRKAEFALVDAGKSFLQATPDFRFAAAVAQFGMMLRQSPHRGRATIGEVIAWAAGAATDPADDRGGYRGEFIDLARQAQEMWRSE